MLQERTIGRTSIPFASAGVINPGDQENAPRKRRSKWDHGPTTEGVPAPGAVDDSQQRFVVEPAEMVGGIPVVRGTSSTTKR